MAIKGGFRSRGEKVWPRDRPETGDDVEFEFDGTWYPGTYDDGEAWPSAVWATAKGAVMPGTHGVACSVAKRWRPSVGAN